MQSAKIELRNTIELRARASELAAPKPDLDAKAKKKDCEALFKKNCKRKITSTKIEKICWQITVAALMQPLQYDLRCPAAKENSLTHTAAAPSNLDAATTMRSADTELQSAIELQLQQQISATVEDVKTKLSCETSFKICKWQNEAFVRDLLQIPTVEDVKT